MLKVTNNRLIQVKQTAKDAGVYLRWGTEKEMINANAKQLEDCIYNPTLGLLARDRYCNPDKIFKDSNNSKKIQLKKSPKTKYFEAILDNTINFLYPKTRKLRQYIIEDKRISIHGIRPCKGYSVLDKIKIFFK